MRRSYFSAAPILMHPFISYLPGGLFVLAKPSDQPNRAAQLLSVRLKRWLRLKEIAMSRSLWSSWIVGLLHPPCDGGGKDETLTQKLSKCIFFMKLKRGRGWFQKAPGEFKSAHG
jgi:hypothetical protein